MSDPDRPTTPADEPAGEYTRFRMNIQRGDGPDRRGDVTVEIQRERAPRTSRINTDVDLPTGDTVRTQTDSRPYAEFVYEVERATELLENSLGLDG